MTRSHRHWYAFAHTYGQNCVDSDGDPIGNLYRFDSEEARDQFVTDADEPYITAPGYTEAIDPREACYRRLIDRARRWGHPIPHGDANRDATITQEGRRTMSEHYNLERFVAAPGDHHEAWCKIDDVWDGEYLTGTIESVPDDRTFIVRAVPSGRRWECRHLGDGRVLEAEVINANL